MSRKSFEKAKKPSEISVLADKYITLKAEEKELTDKLKPVNSDLKTYFANNSDVSAIDGETGAVSISYRKKNVFAEEKMIEDLRELLKRQGILKTKEYIDYGELESALYEKRVTGKEIAPYRKVITTPVLNIKRR